MCSVDDGDADVVRHADTDVVFRHGPRYSHSAAPMLLRVQHCACSMPRRALASESVLQAACAARRSCFGSSRTPAALHAPVPAKANCLMSNNARAPFRHRLPMCSVPCAVPARQRTHMRCSVCYRSASRCSAALSMKTAAAAVRALVTATAPMPQQHIVPP